MSTQATSSVDPLTSSSLEDWGTALFHDSPLAVYLRDADGTLTHANPAMALLFGYDDTEEFLAAMATSLEQFYLDQPARAAVQARLERTGVLLAQQSQALSRDGFVFWIEESARQVRLADGKIRYFGSLRDITSEKSTKWALAEAEEKYRNIFEHAVEGLFQMTPAGRFVMANAALAHMLGHTLPQALTDPTDAAMAAFAHADDWQFLAATLATVGVARSFEVELVRQDGSRIWGSLHVRAVRDGQGRPVLYEGSVEDVTERRRSQERLRQTLQATEALFRQTVVSLSKTVRFRDSYTAAHQDNVARLATATARRLHLAAATVEAIEVAGQLHDIGKINVPVRYLCKPGRLTDLEWEFMKQHVQTGYEILRDIAFPWPVAEIVLAHHERLDGSGYPRGLAGDAIRPEARVLAVADVLDAMASDRPYRPALGLDAALAELTRHKGTRYDPAAVDAIRDVVRHDPNKATA